MMSAGSLVTVSVVFLAVQSWWAGAPHFSTAMPPSGQAAQAPLVAAKPAGAGSSPAPVSSAMPSAAGSSLPSNPGTPSFDIVRVEPTGDAVVAGRAAPNATVQLLDKGKQVASVKADDSGQFALTPNFGVGEHDLSLEANAKDGVSRQSVTVVVPKDSSDRLVVALTAPGQPTRVLSNEPAAPTNGSPPAGKAGQLFVRSVEAGRNGSFFASGTAAPGAPLRVYLNDSAIASVQADASGAWSVKVDRGLTPGSYRVRVDQFDQRTAAVSGRAETKFDFGGFADGQTQVAGALARREAADATPAPGSRAEIADLSTIHVTRGDSLWVISRRIFGHGVRYTLIYDANTDQIRDRNLIYPGQVFVVPKS
jgi:nucleoid-associated protein YgaU